MRLTLSRFLTTLSLILASASTVVAQLDTGSIVGTVRDQWENERAGRPKGEFNQHIAGVTLGGPLLRSRTFFFGDYQATRTDKALTQLATVPAGCVNAAAKTITTSCIDPVAAALLRLYPRANVPAALAAFGTPGGFVSPNYISNGILKNDVDQFDIRVDQNLTRLKSQLFGRYRVNFGRPGQSVSNPATFGRISTRRAIRGSCSSR